MFFKHMFPCIMLMLLASGSAAATKLSFVPDAQEMALMPPYCKVKFTAPQGSPEWQAWRDRIGENFIDIHHYCVGLNYVNRYWGAHNALDRGYYLKNAMDNFNYMVKAAKPGFPLLSELYSNRGDVFKLEGQPGQAIEDYNHAIASNPQATRPYLQLIDLYESQKLREKSLKVATEGLRNDPGSKALQRRYLELGGKRPFPKPTRTEASAPAPVSQPETSASEPVSPVDTSDEPQPKIGSPTNPYCRFCPD